MKNSHKAALILLVLSVAFALCFSGCASDNSSAKTNTDTKVNTEPQITTDQPIFEGKITEIRVDEIELNVTDGKTTGFSKGEPLILITENLDGKLYKELNIGDVISVEFDGTVMNSFPGRIGSISNISKVD